MPRINYQTTMPFNHAEAVRMARVDELQDMLDAAVPDMAREIQLNLHHSLRTKDESQFLADCVAGKRMASPRVMSRLLDLQTRGAVAVHHLLSGAIERVELVAVAGTLCAFEASEYEEQTNGPLNIAQQLAMKEKTPVRWLQVAECGTRQVVATKRLVAAASLQAQRVS